MATEKPSGRVIARENIGTKIISRHSSPSGFLDQRPPLWVKQDGVLDPVADQLLAGSPSSGLPQTSSKIGLIAARNFDSAPERSNVRFLHERGRYTRNLVTVNKSVCFTDDKEPCTVLVMPKATQKASAPTPKRAKRKRTIDPQVGPDGRTLGQRVVLLMSEQNIGQTELARMCSLHFATFVPSVEDKVKQQHIFNIIQGQEGSGVLSLVAAVFDVNDLWLQFGIGDRAKRKN